MTSPTRQPRRTSLLAPLAVAALLGVVVVAAANRSPRSEAITAIVDEVPVVPGALPDGPLTLADASRRVSIEMYTAAWCTACSRAKEWMREQGIAYVEVDVDARAGAMQQLRMLNPRGSVPTFDVDGEVLVGFQQARLVAAITGAADRAH